MQRAGGACRRIQDVNGMLAVGASIDRFERTAVARNWDN